MLRVLLELLSLSVQNLELPFVGSDLSGSESVQSQYVHLTSRAPSSVRVSMVFVNVGASKPE